MKAQVEIAFRWHGDEPHGVEIPAGAVVEGACALNAISMGVAVEVPENAAHEGAPLNAARGKAPRRKA